ncbi:Hydantoinase/oxoprolinase family protein [Candidatus Syntrophocurvum alkaliphilum]|uniref:Hydantoinase/oxoprolinase family protein n=1 Tax=Candidatus Syntrophocurvum alkaliphilum TaxID=2293317 RepID=A0A6I6D9B3_9FIRM|nr:hydantoinase/oxoprolinase family protein [Candidatus Syntrophocurvum alkaliphilum]QGT99435.1 Hydantoinase/oxoprolinase family protein [Candidatus Syntrophocurvum alkaliphilum]
MLIGIDVGGTFTDGVLFDNKSVKKTVKNPTDNQNLQTTLFFVLDELLKSCNPKDIKRVVISTTLITNIIATQSGEKTALILIPGRGLPYSYFNFFKKTFFLSGGIDFRGRVYEKIKEEEVIEIVDKIRADGIKNIAVVSKFSNRNASFENKIKQIINDKYSDAKVITGNEVAGPLNFARRAVTTYYTAMTNFQWNAFVDDLQKAFQERNLNAKIEILKADGGTMSIQNARKRPCETIFSGPAASTMGAIATTMDSKNSIVVDIGGTTSDIALLIEGDPLYASKGARINEKYTHINSFAVRSINLGGDSAITIKNDDILVGPERKGPAACFNGPCPTTTDAFNLRYKLDIGNMHLSEESLRKLAEQLGIDILEVCDKVIAKVINELTFAINNMFKEWETEPAYRIWEILNKKQFIPEQIVGIGAAANAIIPVVADNMGIDYEINQHSSVANALGACLSRPTIGFNMHLDTENKKYVIDLDGYTGKLKNVNNIQLEDAKKIAYEYLQYIADQNDVTGYATNAEFYLEEQFNMIRNWDRVGKIFEIGIQIKPGLINEFTGVK